MELPTPELSLLWEHVTPTNWALLIVLGFLLTFYWYSTSYRGLWEKYNIPVPPAWPIINHYPKFKEGEEAPLEEWFKTYGDTFGTYGMFPHDAVLVTRDLKLLKHILVKDFGNFMNRYLVRITWTSPRDAIFFATGTKWRRCRYVSSPMFTGQKLRAVMTHMTKSADSLKKLIEMCAQNNELVPVKSFSGKFASEMIARVGFGLEAHAVSKEKSEFGYNTDRLLRLGTPLQRLVDSISLYFPPAFQIARALGLKVDPVNEDVDAYFIDILKQEIKRRQSQLTKNRKHAKHIDVLDMLLDAEVPEGDPRLQNVNEKAVTEKEIISNVTNLILAAYETVSSVLQAILYDLAVHQDIQNKVVEEVDSMIPEIAEMTYENVQQLTYTEQVINESLRLQPPVSYITRQALETKTYEGWTIPAGANIMIPIAKIMKDPGLWNEPEKYDPDRFSPENHHNRDPMTFLPFGVGPRVCIGQRFAMIELKVVLATLLKKFRFEMSDRSEPKKGEKIKLVKQDQFFVRPEHPVMLEARPRI